MDNSITNSCSITNLTTAGIKNTESITAYIDDIYNSIFCFKPTPLPMKINLTRKTSVFVPVIEKVEILKENKVTRFTLEDGTVIKNICSDSDTFDFTFAFYLTLAKFIYGNVVTTEGLEYYTNILHYYKDANKWVEKGLKTYKKALKEEAKKIKQEEEQKRIRINKNNKRRKRRNNANT